VSIPTHQYASTRSGFALPWPLPALVLMLICSGARALPAHAQLAIIDLGTIPRCNRCVLPLEPGLLLGEPSGPGIIESASVGVIHSTTSGMYGIFQVGGDQIALFDSTGAFVRRVGRRGPGPGEITRIIDANFADSAIVILDYLGPKLTRIDFLGRHLGDTRVDVQVGRFRVVSDTSIVIGSMDRRPSRVGLPLHQVSIPSGAVIRDFGSESGEWSAFAPLGQSVNLGLSSVTDRIWSARSDRLRLEQWTIDGRRVSVITGVLPWFPKPQSEAVDGRPPTLLLRFGVDASERLWLVVRVPDSSWPSVRRQGAEGLVYQRDYDRFWDTRVDVFDLGTSQHLGSVTWDDASVGLLSIRGEFALYRVISQDVEPQVALYRLNH